MPEADKSKGRRLKVALDVDGVLADVVEVMILVRKNDGFDYTTEEPGEYPGPGRIFMGLDNDQFEKMYNDVWQNRWKQIKSTVSEGQLMEFCKKFDVTLLTSRDDYEKTVKPLKWWLALNYPNLKLDLIVTPKGADKSNLPYDIYIDDAPNLAQKINATEGKRLFLVYAGYNKHVKCDGKKVICVKSLRDAIKILNKEA